MYDVFLSYPHANKAEAQAIRDAMRAVGLEVWMDEERIADYDSIMRNIREGLRNAKALVAYYSEAYRRSRACQWELTAAFLTAQREKSPLQRVLVLNPEDKADHMMFGIRRILSRGRLSINDVKILMGVARQITPAGGDVAGTVERLVARNGGVTVLQPGMRLLLD